MLPLGNNTLVKPENFIQKDGSGVKTGKSTKASHEISCHPGGWQLFMSSLSPLVDTLPHKLLISLVLKDARMPLKGTKLKPDLIFNKLLEPTQKRTLQWSSKWKRWGQGTHSSTKQLATHFLTQLWMLVNLDLKWSHFNMYIHVCVCTNYTITLSHLD